jgi:hypothetical protein
VAARREVRASSALLLARIRCYFAEQNSKLVSLNDWFSWLALRFLLALSIFWSLAGNLRDLGPWGSLYYVWSPPFGLSLDLSTTLRKKPVTAMVLSSSAGSSCEWSSPPSGRNMSKSWHITTSRMHRLFGVKIPLGRHLSCVWVTTKLVKIQKNETILVQQWSCMAMPLCLMHVLWLLGWNGIGMQRLSERTFI